MYEKCGELSCSCVYRSRLCTQMLQIRDVFLGQTKCCSWGRGHIDRPGNILVVIRDVWEVLWGLVQLCLQEEAVYTDAPNKRCFSWSNDVLQLRACWSPGDATNLVETSCYLFGRNNCTRKQHALKAVVKVSRNIELYSCQTTHLKPKSSYQFFKSIRD